MSLQNGFTILQHDKQKLILDKLKGKKGIAYYRKGSFSDELIWQNRKFLFPSPKKKVSKGVWIFRSVQNDVRDFIENKRIREKEKLPVNFWNQKARSFRGKITATDVDHAYWRIAYLDGIIKPKTYKKGLELKDKALRLASLANLASHKEYQIIKDGEMTDKSITLKYDPILQKVYNNIRYTCYEHMMIMAKMLGDDFICYKTDCIYYKDTPTNREIIQTYLDSVSLEWKQLVEPEKPQLLEEDDELLLNNKTKKNEKNNNTTTKATTKKSSGKKVN